MLSKKANTNSILGESIYIKFKLMCDTESQHCHDCWMQVHDWAEAQGVLLERFKVFIWMAVA